MSKASEKKSQEQEAIRNLRVVCRPGVTVYTACHHVSASGMSRRISLHIVRRGAIEDITGWVGWALGYRVHNNGGLIVSGCGMDMGFHLVGNLSYCLHGMKGKGEGVDRHCKARPGHYRAGYSLNHRWI